MKSSQSFSQLLSSSGCFSNCLFSSSHCACARAASPGKPMAWPRSGSFGTLTALAVVTVSAPLLLVQDRVAMHSTAKIKVPKVFMVRGGLPSSRAPAQLGRCPGIRLPGSTFGELHGT
jgi:hypothetical protein